MYLFFNSIQSSSYVVFDSGYKYMYDRYNDVFRYVPLNGDMAGLTARTDLTNDAWFSLAGLNRGIIRGVVNLLTIQIKLKETNYTEAE